MNRGADTARASGSATRAPRGRSVGRGARRADVGGHRNESSCAFDCVTEECNDIRLVRAGGRGNASRRGGSSQLAQGPGGLLDVAGPTRLLTRLCRRGTCRGMGEPCQEARPAAAATRTSAMASPACFGYPSGGAQGCRMRQRAAASIAVRCSGFSCDAVPCGTNSTLRWASSAAARRRRRGTVGVVPPPSMREIAGCFIPARTASWGLAEPELCPPVVDHLSEVVPVQRSPGGWLTRNARPSPHVWG